ncbi:MAG TPA: peptidylprolyl isomerase [Bacteroidota bacterium]|nr:peptidylprolyl isomerase [Bacteroidota bacterium]
MKSISASLLLLPAAVFLLAASAGFESCIHAPERTAVSSNQPMAQAPDSFLVVFETTKGEFVVKAHREWSPLGVDRLYELAGANLHAGAPIFRMIPGKLVQFGLTGDSAVDAAWEARGIADEPVIAKNERGRMSYARSGPSTRSAQLFINLRNNSPRYDTTNAQGVIGYPPIAEVVEGMSTLDSLEGKYGNAPSEFQDSISVKGLRWLDERFPGLDRITRVYVRTQR